MAPLIFDIKDVATNWFRSFAAYVKAGNVDGILSMFLENSYWRDILVFTWDFRTFTGAPKIKQFLVDRVLPAHIKELHLSEDFVSFECPVRDPEWIRATFNFETDVALGSGVFRLVYISNKEWRAHCMFTNIEGLSHFPEKIGELRNHNPTHGNWADQRRREVEFREKDPVVLICGGGQSGLQLAARLKSLDIPTLIVEKNRKVGDNWRNRYETMCLHDPVWYHHMPYIPFPPTWPVYTPAAKLGDWLESYANVLDLNVWTSASVVSASQDESKMWNVLVTRGDGQERTLRVKHFVFATGIGEKINIASGVPEIPSYPEMDVFSGRVFHSTSYKNAAGSGGQKVVIIGSGTSAHDIAVDFCDCGADVTMVQRGPTFVMTTKNAWKHIMTGVYSENALPIDIADRISASFPGPVRATIAKRQVQVVAEDDRDVLDGLKKRGFKLSDDYKDAKFLLQGCVREGGYYLDVGGSQLIIDGKIKLKNDSEIDSFTENGLKFKDGSELPANIVIFATGLGNAGRNIRQICGDKIADDCKHIWEPDGEGEFDGCWRDLGSPGLWYMMGNLGLCRFFSKRVALQIKAMEENVFGTRYRQ